MPKLSDEQEQFIELALEGCNILVDACIGSGKTTAIQELCNRYMDLHYEEGRKILYLTYNKLLKLDAKSKITMSGVTVTNYHGFAYSQLRKSGINAGLNEIIQVYNRVHPCPPSYSLIVIDEYQDIEQESADLLSYLKGCLPDVQIIAVGDMEQKIYDKTRLEVEPFIVELLGDECCRVEFTQCFRISPSLAKMLGDVWDKTIIGVNHDCRTYKMTFAQTREFLLSCEPRDILCLGQNMGQRSAMLNELEQANPNKFNKYTIWSKINDFEGEMTQPSPDAAIFTTYDGCKGMERDVCVVFDWTDTYWHSRLDKPSTKYEIIRNIFCVAASRGKRVIIFVKYDDNLKMDTLKKSCKIKTMLDDMQISSMFDHKYIEDVESAYSELSTCQIEPPRTEIPISTQDGLIDVSPCIGIYQEAAYFNNYDIEKDIQQFFQINRNKSAFMVADYVDWELSDQILYYVMLETNQNRYANQVRTPLVRDEDWTVVEKRLSEKFSKHESVQHMANIDFYTRGKKIFSAKGFCDVIKPDETGRDVVYELKFVSELSHTHFLQCACYMIALNYETGYLWNVRNGEMYKIQIPNRQKFMNKVVNAITKGKIKTYCGEGTCQNKKRKQKNKKQG